VPLEPPVAGFLNLLALGILMPRFREVTFGFGVPGINGRSVPARRFLVLDLLRQAVARFVILSDAARPAGRVVRTLNS
jgi:hypothetical protein